MAKQELLNTDAAFDLRLEAVAAALLEATEEFEIDQLVVAPQGHDQRRSTFEVGPVRRRHYDHDEVLQLEVHRKGLFDTLPPGLFIGLDDEKHDTPKKRTRAIRRQTADARKFFLPFEQAMYHPRIEAEQLEQKLTLNFPVFINRLWGLDRFEGLLDDRQLFLLCHLLPEAYRMVGNWQLTGLCFEGVLRKPVGLNFVAPRRNAAAELAAPLEKLRMGTNSILGGEFDDDMPALEVSVWGVTYQEIEDFLPGGNQRIVLEDLLYGYFLPLEVAVITKIIVTEDTWTGEFGRGIIGYNLMLN